MNIAPDWSPRELERWREHLLEIHHEHRARRHEGDSIRNAIGDASILALDKGEVETAACLMFVATLRYMQHADKALTVLNDLTVELDQAERMD